MRNEKTIAFHTLGCKLNFSETDTISRDGVDKGYKVVPFTAPADIYVINSCTVTKNAEKRCKALIRQAIKTNPASHIAVIGCFSQIKPDEIANLPGVSMVIGNADKFNLFEHLKGLADGKPSHPASQSAGKKPESFMPSFSMDGRTRSFFKIQDGCDYMCAYCTIPMARGRSRSQPIASTLETARQIAGTNMKEIVLTGVNIGDFGKAHNESFFDLLRELALIDGLERIRISSVEPDLLHNDIIRLVANEPKLMPHFHIPLQSGSDKVLNAMGRRYDTGLFSRRIETIRKHIPHACIAADLIVGFPGESESLFMDSYNFITDADISYLHVFTYSERENTAAERRTDQVPQAERKRRSKLMQAISANKKQRFIQKNKGLTTKVLWEKEQHNGLMYGFTENYLKVKTPFQANLVNQIMTVKLNNTDLSGVYII